MSIELREPKTADDFALYYDLRWRILREPWTQDRESSKDEHEALAVHLMAWVDNKLVGVGYVDHLPSVTAPQSSHRIPLDVVSARASYSIAGGLSAIYFFYDPEERDRSLGTWNVLCLIDVY